jgi:hypothetical protein
MTKSSKQDFWKRQFEAGGNLPGSWFGRAFDLLTSADVLDRFSGDLQDEILEAKMTQHRFERMSVVKVSHMLRAMATECLLKALWLKNGGMLAKDGRYVGMLKKKEHRLQELAKAVSRRGQIIFTLRELELLEQVSYWITSSRYPIQREFTYLLPFSRSDGTLAPHQFWRGYPLEELKMLIEKLQRELGIEMKLQPE